MTHGRVSETQDHQANPAMNGKAMTMEDLRELANIFKAMGELSRLLLLKALMAHGELSVGALVNETELTQANVSKHLKHLNQAGLVSTRREGNTIHYRIAGDLVYDLCALCCDRIEEKRSELLKKLTSQGVGS